MDKRIITKLDEYLQLCVIVELAEEYGVYMNEDETKKLDDNRMPEVQRLQYGKL